MRRPGQRPAAAAPDGDEPTRWRRRRLACPDGPAAPIAESRDRLGIPATALIAVVLTVVVVSVVPLVEGLRRLAAARAASAPDRLSGEGATVA